MQTNQYYGMKSPFFDLTRPQIAASITSNGPLMAFDAMFNPEMNFLERIPGDDFRYNLIAQSGLDGFASHNPLEQHNQRITCQWQEMCERVRRFASLPSEDQVSLFNLLKSLGFSNFAVQLLTTRRQEPGRFETVLELNLEVAKYTQRLPSPKQFDISKIARIAHDKWQSPRLRHFSALFLVVHFAKVLADRQSASEYRTLATGARMELRAEQSKFDASITAGRHWRAVSLVSSLEGDREQVGLEMQAAFEEVSSISPTRPHESLVKDDAMISILESRMREALLRGDVDLAMAFIFQAHERDPWDPKVLMEVAELYYRQGRFRLASEYYLKATLFGPPGSALSSFLAGDCFERLEDYERSQQCYLETLYLDPRSISGIRALIRVSSTLSDIATAAFARTRLLQLNRLPA